ncbi:MAG: DMT family transporter [Opitutaceae bacterium]|nr:DMT family transporter [Opitutaceae bacterium]
MIASLLAAFFFALTATCGSYNVRANGPVRGNIGRLCVAAVVLGLFAHMWGNGFASASVAWFLMSGVLGMGIGDIGVYAALPLLGSRLTVLMTQCLAAPIAAVGEWLWLGTRLTAAQILWGVVILGGVVLALMPSKASPPRVIVRPAGYVFGLLAAVGQGIGALLSRKGVMVATAAGETVQSPVFGVNAAYHRIFAGLVFVVLWFALMRALGRMPVPVTPPTRVHGFRWIVASGLTGSVVGVGCYQWALATSPSGLVLPIAATAPLLAMPITYWLEGDRPSRRAVVGGVVAVAGCVALTLAR